MSRISILDQAKPRDMCLTRRCIGRLTVCSDLPAQEQYRLSNTTERFR